MYPYPRIRKKCIPTPIDRAGKLLKEMVEPVHLAKIIVELVYLAHPCESINMNLRAAGRGRQILGYGSVNREGTGIAVL